MKQLLLSISIICSINCFAQAPNPDLFQTWYLQSVVVSDGSEPTYIVSDIEPTITPSLTIMEDLTFSGIGACNTFNGAFNVPFLTF
jgi:heat shock protein HslJ